MKHAWIALGLIGFELLRSAGATEPPPAVVAAEARRIAVVERVSRSTVAIFESSGTNGGSGVIVSPEGLVVTNYHVTEPCGPTMLCGTDDGRVHRAVLLGVDPTGDIALVRLLGDRSWPAAEWGDSDRVRVGDTAIVAGNPFLLAEDFTPTVTVGVISGVHRYQGPSGDGLLEYADCLQTDAAINPGNSGGPLFDGEGRLIGINGRGSFEKRGRVNVGVGYAVSSNQVRRFVSHLVAGRLVDHASLGAAVVTRSGPQAIVSAIETDSDAYRRGLRAGDELVSFDGRDTPTANALLNAVGVLPAGWRSRIEFRRGGRLYRRDVRLRALHAPGELTAAVTPEKQLGDEDLGPDERPDIDPSVYEAREGYANYAATRIATSKLLDSCLRWGGAPDPAGNNFVYRNPGGERIEIRLADDTAVWLTSTGEFTLDTRRSLSRQASPPAAPPLMAALWVWRQLVADATGLDSVEAVGRSPWEALGTPHDVLRVTHQGLLVDVYFDPHSSVPRAIEASRDAAEDAVRIDFDPTGSGPRVTAGVLPAEMLIAFGDRDFQRLTAAPVRSQEGER